MAGYREFQTGEVLTAANVNDYLAKQSVLKFADAAARDTALGTAVGGANALREGMVAYLDSTDEVLAYNGTAWATVGNAGIGSNVVQSVKTDTFSTTSASYTTVTGLSAAITPSTATSKVLVVANVVAGFDNDGNAVRTGLLSLFRGATNLSNPTSPGTSRTLAFTNVIESATARESKPYTMVFLDSPATTSSTTYTVEARKGSGGTLFVNRGETYDDSENVAATVSIITLIEVAA